MSNPEVMLPNAFAWDSVNKNTIQDERQPSQPVQDATLKDGFPLITMTPQDAGGIAPNGQDFNGILYEISLDTVHRQKGLRIQFDPNYAAKIGGYSIGSILASSDYQRDYISLIDNNLTDPNGSGTAGRWAIYSGAGSVVTATASIAGIAKLNNTLTSTATDAALTAAQGNVLNNTKLGKMENALSATKLATAIGSAPSFSARAIAAFSGSGGVTAQTYLNVASVVRNSVGDYTINFATAMPNANYAVLLSGCRTVSPTAIDGIRAYYNRTTTSVRIKTMNTEDMKVDHDWISVVIFC